MKIGWIFALSVGLFAASASAESCVRGVKAWTAEEAIKLETERIVREGYHLNCSQTSSEVYRTATSDHVRSHVGDGDYYEILSLPWGADVLEKTDDKGRKYFFFNGVEGVAKVRFPAPRLTYQPGCGWDSHRLVPPAERPTWTCLKHVKGNREPWTEFQMRGVMDEIKRLEETAGLR